jgi:hypothetical protein
MLFLFLLLFVLFFRRRVFILLLSSAAVALSVSGSMSCAFLKVTAIPDSPWDWITSIPGILDGDNNEVWVGIFRYGGQDGEPFGATCANYEQYFAGNVADYLQVAQICGVVAPGK